MQRIQRLLAPSRPSLVSGRGVVVLAAATCIALTTAWTVHARQAATQPATSPAAAVDDLAAKFAAIEAGRAEVQALLKEHSAWSPEVTAARTRESDAMRGLVKAFLDRFDALAEPPAARSGLRRAASTRGPRAARRGSPRHAAAGKACRRDAVAEADRSHNP